MAGNLNPYLVSLTQGPDLPLSKPIVLIGRHQECDIQIPSRKISRRHCCLAQVNKHLVVRDLGSTNGIRINGVKVEEGNLHEGDELTVGNFRYKVQFHAPTNDKAPADPGAKDLGDQALIDIPLVLGEDLEDADQEQLLDLNPVSGPKNPAHPPVVPPPPIPITDIPLMSLDSGVDF